MGVPHPSPPRCLVHGDLQVLMDGSVLLSYANWKLAQVMFGSYYAKFTEFGLSKGFWEVGHAPPSDFSWGHNWG